MSRRVNLSGTVKQRSLRSHSESESEERVLNVAGIRPETGRATHGQGEASLISRWRPEPFVGAKTLDELWVEVRCRSNSEIAGSPRNALRCSLRIRLLEVGH